MAATSGGGGDDDEHKKKKFKLRGFGDRVFYLPKHNNTSNSNTSTNPSNMNVRPDQFRAIDDSQVTYQPKNKKKQNGDSGGNRHQRSDHGSSSSSSSSSSASDLKTQEDDFDMSELQGELANLDAIANERASPQIVCEEGTTSSSSRHHQQPVIRRLDN